AHAEAIEMMALETTDRALPPYAERFVDTAGITPEWRFVEGICYEEAIEVAFDAASHASLLYSALADGAPEPAAGLLRGLAEQQEAHVNRLVALRQRPSVWTFRKLGRMDVRQGIRNGIAAELAAAQFHAALGSRATERPARIFLQQLAIEEEAQAEQLEVLVLEKLDWSLPPEAESQASTIKLAAFDELRGPVSLAAALEHALFSQTRGALYYRILAGLAPPEVAPHLERFAHDQEEHLAQLIARRNTYWVTHAEDVPSMSADELNRLLRTHQSD
ncbi:MAG: hypothetical protein ACOC1F_06450, partial [Myxococcota bacterium]